MANSQKAFVRLIDAGIGLLASLSICLSVMMIYRPPYASKSKTASDSKARKNQGSGVPKIKWLSSGGEYWPAPAEATSQQKMVKSEGLSRVTEVPHNPPAKAPLELPVTDIKAILKDAIALVDEGDPDGAILLFQRVLSHDPINELALNELGMLFLIDRKDPDTALDYLKRSIDTNPSNRIILLEIIGVYEELGRGPEGVAHLRRLYDENPQNANLALAIGQALAAQDQLIDALPFIEMSIDHNPSSVALAELADVYSQLGDKEKSLENSPALN